MRNLLLALVLFMLSCTQKQHDIAQIKDQLISITKEYDRIWETLKVDSIAQLHADENFVYYWHGQLAAGNNKDFKKLFSEILSGTTSWSMKTSQPLVQVINNNAAVVSFTFDAESIEINGTKTNESGALTYIWNKIKDKWKLIHIHESVK